MTLPPSQDFTHHSADRRLELLEAWLQSHAARYSLDLGTLA
ncbi:MAG: aminoglycoside phosphotransferase, partial [Paraburkholderia caledonica]